MISDFKMTRRVEFAETDMAGIVHFSNFFRYMETAEHEFFRSLGLSLHKDEDGHVEGWVRVHAACDYVSPARYQDLLEIRLVVRKKGTKSMRYGFGFHVVDEDAGTAGPEIATGELVCVHAERVDGEGKPTLVATPIPDEIAQRVAAAPCEPGEPGTESA